MKKICFLPEPAAQLGTEATTSQARQSPQPERRCLAGGCPHLSHTSSSHLNALALPIKNGTEKIKWLLAARNEVTGLLQIAANRLPTPLTD